MATTRLPEKLTTLPDVPKEFGGDGGHFYRYYDDLAEETDDDLAKGLKSQLDGILIFAGLFAGVNSSFLAFTLPQMSPDPAYDTNALLLQIALGRNDSIRSAADLPSASFTPSPRMYPINVLFSVSLTLALVSSFLAVLGQQWLVYYLKRSGGGPEHQRWEQLRRYLGARRWHLELVLDDLVPSLLQLGLVIFCIAFALYLGTLSQSMFYIIASILIGAGAIILLISACAAFDPWCPFKSPLSRIIRPLPMLFVTLIFDFFICVLIIALTALLGVLDGIARLGGCFGWGEENRMKWSEWDPVKITIDLSSTFYQRGMSRVTRSPDDPQVLKIWALKRVICTSEDPAALVRAAMNLQSIKDKESLSSLLTDEEFCSRLHLLAQKEYHDASQHRLDNMIAIIEARAFSTAYLYLMLSAGSFDELCWSMVQDRFAAGIGGEDQINDIRMAARPKIQALCRNASAPCTGGCDQCSHCTTLSFIARVPSLHPSEPSQIRAALDDAGASLTRSDELKLGYVVASAVMNMSRGLWLRWTERQMETLFNAYRETSPLSMFQVIGTAIATVDRSAGWKPGHELYVRLFELCLFPEREDESGDMYHQEMILEHFGRLLSSLETKIRDQATSEIDRTRGREQQNRCVESVAEFLEASSKLSSPDRKLRVIRESLRPYVDLVKEQLEEDRTNPENARALDILRSLDAKFLRRGKEAFDEPDADSAQYCATLRELLDSPARLANMGVPEGCLTLADVGAMIGRPVCWPPMAS